MSKPLDAHSPRDLSRLLQSVSARLSLRDAIRGLSGAAVVASVLFAVVRAAGGGAMLRTLVPLLVGLSVWTATVLATRRSRSPREAARHVERANPGLRNIVITAEEMLRRGDAASPHMRARVVAAAASHAADISSSDVVPITTTTTTLVLACVVSAVVVLVSPTVLTVWRPHTSDQILESNAKRPSDLIVDVTPPAYTARQLAHLSNPLTIDAIAGSHAAIVLTNVSDADEPRLRVNGSDVPLRRVGQTRTAEIALNESGYLAVDHLGPHGQRLVPVSVTPDRAPTVRITAPAKDLRVADTSRSIPIEADASDDLGLASMEIRYTRISGTGEQFQFHEGTLTAQIDRRSQVSWRASAQLALGSMKLEPGDALVYRATARDGRPGDTGLGTSDTYFVEIAGPGEVALAGFDMPPDRERYALSQQMIVLKIERLRAREASMTHQALQDETANIAAEQRAVRANFVFLLGGSVEDEEQEAEGSTEILEGRFENQARRDVVEAIRLMSLAERGLAAASTSTALPPARAAAQALQRAFGHSRYLLRTLPTRGRIDPSRRLTGDRAGADDWRRAIVRVNPDPSTRLARQALDDLLSVAASLAPPGSTVAATSPDDVDDRLGRLAEQLLRIDPTAADIQSAARDVTSARDAVVAGRVADAQALLQRAAPAVVSRAQRGLANTKAPSLRLDVLAGALAVEGARR
jgi:hypothetical protein